MITRFIYIITNRHHIVGLDTNDCGVVVGKVLREAEFVGSNLGCPHLFRTSEK